MLPYQWILLVMAYASRENLLLVINITGTQNVVFDKSSITSVVEPTVFDNFAGKILTFYINILFFFSTVFDIM